MEINQIKARMKRDPFRPFGIRLVNGAVYEFRERRDFGAPRDFHTLFYFGPGSINGGAGYFEIDPDKISEIFELRNE